ncbi:MAG: MFS transporter [Candidatus Helarchaeota archaeon]
MEFDYKKISIIGLGLFTTGIAWNMFSSYIPIFLSYFGISYIIIGLIMTIDNFIAITIQPYIGSRSDKTWSDKYGRRMPYLLVGIPFAAFFFATIPLFIPKNLISFDNYKISVSPDLNIYIFLIIWIICFDISMAIYRAPVTALLPDLVDNEHRSKGNGVVQLMGGIGAIIAYTIGAILYRMGAIIAFLFTAIVMIISLCIMVVKIKEPRVPMGTVNEEDKVNIIEGFREVFRSQDRSILLILIATFYWYFGYQALATFFTTYGVRVLFIGEATASSYLTLIIVPAIIAAIPSGILGEKISRKKTIIIGLLLMVLSFLTLSLYSIFFITPVNPILIPLFQFNTPKTMSILILICFPIMGISWSLIDINSITIIWEVAKGEKQGTYTGIYYTFSQAAAIVAPPLMGLFFDLARTPLPLFPISCIFYILALILMFFVRKSD